jgi:hypothetical protein
MKRIMLLSTCAAALTLWMNLAASPVAFAQESGASSQQRETSGHQTKQMRPAAKSTQPMDQSKQGSAAEEKSRPDASAEMKKKDAAESEKSDMSTNRKAGAQKEQSAEQKEQSQDKTKRTPSSQTKGQDMSEPEKRSGEATEQRRPEKGATESAHERKGAAGGEATEQRRPEKGANESAQERKGAVETTTGPAKSEREMSAQGRMKLDQRQASDLRSRLEKRGGENTAGSATFSARVGGRVPEGVRLLEAPSDIVEVYPQFRGYDYVVEGDEIIFVDPRTREVVEIVGSPEHRAAAESRHERLRLSREQNELIRRNVHIDPSMRVEFDEGREERVPATLALLPLPGPVLAEIPDARDYQYFVDQNDHIVIVDPATHEIVDVVD